MIFTARTVSVREPEGLVTGGHSVSPSTRSASGSPLRFAALCLMALSFMLLYCPPADARMDSPQQDENAVWDGGPDEPPDFAPRTSRAPRATGLELPTVDPGIAAELPDRPQDDQRASCRASDKSSVCWIRFWLALYQILHQSGAAGR